MNIFMSIYVMILFYVLIPGQFFILPSNTDSKTIVNLTHCVIIGVIWFFTHKMVYNATSKLLTNQHSSNFPYNNS